MSQLKTATKGTDTPGKNISNRKVETSELSMPIEITTTSNVQDQKREVGNFTKFYGARKQAQAQGLLDIEKGTNFKVYKREYRTSDVLNMKGQAIGRWLFELKEYLFRWS